MTLQVLLGHVAEGLHRGEQFYVPLQHTVITGMTQYGKSTTEEAMLHRIPETTPPYRSLVFLTKRGEKTFQGAHVTEPFYRARFDWEYVRGLLESAMRERLKFETPWIIKICKLAELEVKRQGLSPEEGLFLVRKLLGDMLQHEKLRDFDRNIYTLLAAYLDKVLPVLKQAIYKFTATLTLMPGINVMDLTPWYTHEEVQMLVIRSCMEQILERENNVIVGLPEAWKLLPQNRNTPVKLYFEKFVREGATNGNYLYIDAQDLGGVDKTPLRQVGVWIMGHMQEANEVERLLDQTLGVKVPASVIQTLPLGHFLVAAGEKVTKVYVWPDGVPEEMSIAVARGSEEPETVKEYIQKRQEEAKQAEFERTVQPFRNATQMQDIEKRVDALSRRFDNLNRDFESLSNVVRDLNNDMGKLLQANTTSIPGGDATLEQTTRKVTVVPHELTFKLTTENAAGKIMWLAKEGFLNTWRSRGEVEKQLTSAHGWTLARITIYKALEQLVNDGFLGFRKTDRGQFKLADFVTISE